MKTIKEQITIEFNYWGPYGDLCITQYGSVFNKRLLDSPNIKRINTGVSAEGLHFVTEQVMDAYQNDGRLSRYKDPLYESTEKAIELLEANDLSRLVRQTIFNDHMMYDMNREPIKRAFYIDWIDVYCYYMDSIKKYNSALMEIKVNLENDLRVRNLESHGIIPMNRRDFSHEKSFGFSFVPTDSDWNILKGMKSIHAQNSEIMKLLGVSDILSKYERTKD